ncbi:methylenetetrahydrofolate dehydrogenase (NADP+) / methenyltetrahydrofolate cyclohydrolase [Ketogulonicigenium robustum]|uniref:methenyltetrahydrofolate cyclohydrolase n=1 Tax=Ketogulonicigenium robustum TaxID=92947 RepID=A0A1W6P0V3_9RHOB|nr:bifunctional 5,10-methylenetetrahydrofolate dehydrogenase/5,10-methenyltetrahydrofolate cyclohydrolase [Ketogulonicigenium robustum]ARO15031.1 methylenetetrahydrofolate dehydrogenase (NADP+) / methenyltetrahydrofolate cyclohydrolase [Ketogulonicigenium robustum]
MTTIFTGFALADSILADVAAAVQALGRAPVCVTLHDPANGPARAYLARQIDLARAAGITLRAESYADAPLDQLAELAADPGLDAVATLFPLPPGLTPALAASAIGPQKDVDGQHPLLAGPLLLGEGTPRPAATAMASLLCARAILGDLRGQNVTIIGASRLIGRPLSMLLTDAGATVTLCHIDTRDLPAHTRAADLVISAAGVAGLLGRDHIAQGGRVLDLAIIPKDGGLIGDADLADLMGHAAIVSHVPNGVGPVTAACLLNNIVAAARGGDAL